MKKLQAIISALGLIGIVLLNGCNDGFGISRILLLDMDQFNNNTNLAVSLPGPPSGDRAENIDNATLANNEAITGQSIRMAGQIDLIPLSHQPPAEYIISWDGFRSNIANTTNTSIAFMDQSGNIAFRIVFNGATGQYKVEAGGPVPDRDYDIVGHKFTITMKPAINQFDFKFEQDDCNGNKCADFNGLSFINSGFTKLSRVRFEGGEYFFDDFSVIVKSPN